MKTPIRIDLPLIPQSENTVAFIIDIETGEVVDEAYNYETAINYIGDLTHIAIAVQDEVHWCRTWPLEARETCSYCETYGPVIRTREALQAAFDHERAVQADCFGLPLIEVVAA